MTARAIRLTAGASVGTASPSTLPATQLRAFTDALERLGYDVPGLLAGAGLGPGDLAYPDARLPCTAFGRVLAGACAAGRHANLGARLAALTPMGAYPLLDYLVLTTNTVGDALEQLVRYFHVVAAPVRLGLAEAGDAIRLLVHPGDDAFQAEYETTLVVHHLRAETEQRIQISFVSLMHEPEDVVGLERLLGCPVRGRASWSGVELPRRALSVRLRRREPALRRILESHAATLPRAVELGEPSSAAEAVRGILASRFGRRLPSMADAARLLDTSPRTLQRRLAAEGLTYARLVEDVRREAAERLLLDGSLAIGEIACMLGFSEPSAFNRAFRRWHAMAPGEYRSRMRPDSMV